MMPSPLCITDVSVLLEKAEQLESYIEELQRQRNSLQLVDDWTSKFDFADFMETVSLLELHIDLNQKELRAVKVELAQAGSSFS